MDNISKLAHLLSHWVEHNQSHESTYLDWIQRAEKAGRRDVAAEIRKSLELSQGMSRHFEKAVELLKGGRDV